MGGFGIRPFGMLSFGGLPESSPPPVVTGDPFYVVFARRMGRR